MCRATDLAGIRQLNNDLDKSEFDIEKVAKEMSLPVDPNNLVSISVGQYCIDQLKIMQVNSSIRSILFMNIQPNDN
jgi:hypothetical protein